MCLSRDTVTWFLHGFLTVYVLQFLQTVQKHALLGQLETLTVVVSVRVNGVYSLPLPYTVCAGDMSISYRPPGYCHKQASHKTNNRF